MSKSQLLKQFKQYTKDNRMPFTDCSDNAMRIMVFNVHIWKDIDNKDRYRDILEVIGKSNADIIGLIEIMLYNISFENLKNNLAKIGYDNVIVSNSKFGINLIGTKKLPFVSWSNIRLIKDPIKNMTRHALFASIMTKKKNNKIINIVLTHLDIYDETEQTRYKQIKQILHEIKHLDHKNDIIFGDFNSLRMDDYTETEWANIIDTDKQRGVTTQTIVTELIERSHHDSFDLVSSDTEDENEENKHNITVWSNRRVDYVYFNKKSTFKVISSNVYPTLVSDHYPVYVDFC